MASLLFVSIIEEELLVNRGESDGPINRKITKNARQHNRISADGIIFLGREDDIILGYNIVSSISAKNGVLAFGFNS